jgi:hypothetical protein
VACAGMRMTCRGWRRVQLSLASPRRCVSATPRCTNHAGHRTGSARRAAGTHSTTPFTRSVHE